MKIVLVTDVFPPASQTSIGSIVKNLAQGFQIKGHEVLVITPTTNKKEAGPNQYQGLNVWLVYTNYPARLMHFLNLYNPLAVRTIRKIFRRFQPDIVHAHTVHVLLSYAILKLAKKAKAKVFLTIHDADLFIPAGKFVEFIDRDPAFKAGLKINQTDNNYQIFFPELVKRFKKRMIPFRKTIIKYYLKYVDKIFSVSRALAIAHGQNGIKNIIVIHNGLRLEEWQTSQEARKKFREKFQLNNKKVVFFGGRLHPFKGAEQIIKAMALVIKEVPDAILLVAGKKDAYASEMMKLAAGYSLPVVFADWLLPEEIKVAYGESAVVVTPSIYLDPFPTINLEAMACGRPVVGTCFGGTPEVVVDNETGFIVNPFNLKIMSERIVTLLKNPALAEKMGQAGQQRIKEEFNLNQQVMITLAWYKKFLA